MYINGTEWSCDLHVKQCTMLTFPACLPSGGALSQLSDSGQTLSEDSGVDIAETGHIGKDSSPHSSRTRLPRDTQGGGGDNPSKPVRGGSDQLWATDGRMREFIVTLQGIWFVSSVFVRTCLTFKPYLTILDTGTYRNIENKSDGDILQTDSSFIKYNFLHPLVHFRPAAHSKKGKIKKGS